MSLLRPEISQVLRNAGISNGGFRRERQTPDDANTITDKLDAAGLSIVECFDELRNIIGTGDSDTVKLNAVKLALEAHKALKGDMAVGTVVNIIINDGSTNTIINPMLLPRQLQGSMVELEG